MTKRSLSAIEIAEAQSVFGSSLHYDRIRLTEGAPWPDWIAHIGAWFSRSDPPPHNAVTLGNTITFPVALRTTAADTPAAFVADMAWLIHELTHVWQFQHQGLGYLPRAFWEQLWQAQASYDYGGEQGLKHARVKGLSITDLKLEQQGEVTRHFYTRAKSGRGTDAWDPFIEDLRTSLVE